MTCGTVKIRSLSVCLYAGAKQVNMCVDQGIPITDAGIAALNKTDKGEYVEAVGSDPNNPTYVGVVEVFHQLHCLVSISYSLATTELASETRYFP
jgi:hypothetical protein